MKTSYMDRDITGAIKGIALICMFVHHFFTFPGYLIDGIDYPWITEFSYAFCEPMKICVPAFAFLTGYFYAFCKTRTYRYSFRKITDLYVSYWFVYLVILAFALVAGCFEVSLYSIAFELTAIRTTLMVFCWYVLFYAFSMLLLPLLTHSNDHTPAEDILLLLILPVTVSSVLLKMELSGLLYDLVFFTRDWFPSMAVGYLFGKYHIFEAFFDRLSGRCHSSFGKVLLWVGMVFLACGGRYYCQFLHLGTLEIREGMFSVQYTMDILYAPLFVYGCAKLLFCLRGTMILKILNQIGKHSLSMWFFHCIFFNDCRDLLQPVLYWPRNPVLVVLFGLLLCYLPSLLVDPMANAVNRLKNRIL